MRCCRSIVLLGLLGVVGSHEIANSTSTSLDAAIRTGSEVGTAVSAEIPDSTDDMVAVTKIVYEGHTTVLSVMMFLG